MTQYKKASWKDTHQEFLDPKLSQQVFTSQNVMVVHYVYEPGLQFESHSHPQEQVTIVQSGRLLLTINGERVELGTGDICSIAPNVNHSSMVIGDEKVDTISIFTPITDRVVIQKR
ncbi:MAG: cupin domain-containing protein [Calditrichales bacterium]|nr:MAG: cupin domain-containing protein [Calditrichales bacterium]